MTLSNDAVLGDQGLIARRLSNYESRPQQLEMADAVAAAISSQQHLVVEAGTGVGKSFAYLVPAILAATQPQLQADESGKQPAAETKSKRIVISTHTIALQEQLIQKDIPFLASVLPVEFSAVLVKGRSNYLSLRRLKGASERSSSTLFEREAVQQLRSIQDWSTHSRDGSLADLSFKPQREVWDDVQSEHGNCLGRKCPTYDDCFYYRARRRVWNANVLVVNHALFFSDLALRREGASILPEYDVVVFDEAHTVEAVAGDHLGISVSLGQFRYLFAKLFNDRQGKGLLVHHNLQPAQKMIMRLHSLTEDFFAQVEHWRDSHARSNGRVRRPPDIRNPVSPDLRELRHTLLDFADGLTNEAEQMELKAAADRLGGLATSLDTWLKQSIEDGVYWIESTGGRQQNVKLVSAPVEVGPVLRDELFSKIPSVILTSATLSVGKQDFSHFRSRIGLTSGGDVKLGSPFNYREQATLVLAADMPDPVERLKEFEAELCRRIQKHVLETDGRAFVLFTSYRTMKQSADLLTPWFVRERMPLLVQGTGMDRTKMLQQFQREPRSVLFGTDSFWQGVDVPGDALQNVIITKLPFSVPDEPLLEARVERIKERGGNPFMEYQVPEAAIKLRQGFGRLIRSQTDTGQVVILDPRIKTKRYGRIFLDSLPACRTVISGK
ncbi:MAG: ATP-dependent DNA helicase [Planctomycetaceae bacterium]